MTSPRTRLIALAVALSIPFTTAAAHPADDDETPTVATIMERHIEARGGREALARIENVVFSRGLYREPGYEGAGKAFMARARPYYKVVGNPESPGGFMEGYDGATWEWFADPGISIRTVGEAAAAGRHGVLVEGSLIGSWLNGDAVTLNGRVAIDGRPTWHLTLTMADGFRSDHFVDAETWLVAAERASAPIHAYGEPVTRESRLGDWREIGGVLFPHHYAETDIATGEMVSEMRWRSIEVNRDLPAWWFSPPRNDAPSPLQRFLEHLYVQRTDADAVMWTYREFRRLNPKVDTAPGVELIGYQMLKMGDVQTAVRLLEANAADHPGSASAAFGLGRAYGDADRIDDARRSYERALEIDPEHRRAAAALTATE